MKLTQLEYFCVAARYHNITKASKELFVTPTFGFKCNKGNWKKSLELIYFTGIIIS